MTDMDRITESSEVLAFMEHAFSYRSIANLERADRGRKLIESHPDFGKMKDDSVDELRTAAVDTIADILHALNAAGVLDVELGPGRRARVQDLVDQAVRTYDGDFEDEHDPEAGEPRG